jgi:hypothetical protein
MAFREFLESYFDGSADGLIEFLGEAQVGQAQALAPVSRSATAASDSGEGRLDTALL